MATTVEGESKTTVNFGDNSSIDFSTKTWMTDVTFVIEGKRLYASKSILALFSPVLDCMFSLPFKEKSEDEIVLSGKNPDDFLEFLHCIYPTSGRSVTKKNVLQLIPLADEYQVTSLMKQCREVLVKHITTRRKRADPNYLVHCYSLVMNHNITDLGPLCIQKLLEICNIKHVMTLSQSILDKDTLSSFTTGLVIEQTNRLNKVNINFVKTMFKSLGVNVDGFEESEGVVLEYTIEDVLDLIGNDRVISSAETVFNASFMLAIYTEDSSTSPSIADLLDRECMRVAVYCQMPAGYSCDVKVAIKLEIKGTGKNNVISDDYTTTYTSGNGYAYSYKVKFGYGTITAYILAKKPTEVENINTE